ncbi:ribose-phosphate pyrophosphokinase [Entomophthora muscae]|uniref:Ribose-phosphate pyrophosphokinase n=2 Tax=Entomophthora muscae TaxID=34485 RepID=A0ACC2U5K7_9FUNG|nr:ribose-phosphate pyrophosphokinase [Entomophthora muscae]
MKNIVIFSGSSHPQFVDSICDQLGIERGKVKLNKFSNMETNIEFQESVRGKDVFIVQSGCGNVNDSIMELLIMVGACKTATAKSVNAVLPSFPYARQPDVPYAKSHSSILRFWTPQASGLTEKEDSQIMIPEPNSSAMKPLDTEDVLASPEALGFGISPLQNISYLDESNFGNAKAEAAETFRGPHKEVKSIDIPKKKNTDPSGYRISGFNSLRQEDFGSPPNRAPLSSSFKADSPFKLSSLRTTPFGSLPARASRKESYPFTLNESDMPVGSPTSPMILPALNYTTMAEILQTKMISTAPQPKKEVPQDLFYSTPVPKSTGYKRWSARTGTLVANLLTEIGADRIITMDLHDPQFQGYFDVPVDLLYAEPSILYYIKNNIPDYQNAVIVSPDAGGAKRATSIANKLRLNFALIHKEGKVKNNKKISLVGDVKDKVAIIIDDIADTCGTLGLAAEILVAHGAREVHAIVTHGMLSGPAIEVINGSALSSVAVTNTIPQDEKLQRCSKLVSIDVSSTFAEAIRRIYYGESLTQMFKTRWF